jgi:hypothetical protein
MNGMYKMMNQQRGAIKSSMPMPVPSSSLGMAQPQIMAAPKMKQTDEMSSNVYANSRINSKQFQKKK